MKSKCRKRKTAKRLALFLGRFGEAAVRFVLLALGGLLLAGTIFGVVRMVLNYKLRKKNMEYAYKREVMDRLDMHGQTIFIATQSPVSRGSACSRMFVRKSFTIICSAT